MIKEIAGRACLSCQKSIKGRTDKKFCDDFCRNNYNNRIRGDDNNYMRNINNALRKNRRALALLLDSARDGKTTVPKDRLAGEGFNFKYITHTYTTKEGKTYYYCYDYGYMPLSDNRYLLVKREKYP
jgi:hypothetical protein